MITAKTVKKIYSEPGLVRVRPKSKLRPIKKSTLESIYNKIVEKEGCITSTELLGCFGFSRQMISNAINTLVATGRVTEMYSGTGINYRRIITLTGDNHG